MHAYTIMCFKYIFYHNMICVNLFLHSQAEKKRIDVGTLSNAINFCSFTSEDVYLFGPNFS